MQYFDNIKVAVKLAIMAVVAAIGRHGGCGADRL